MNDSKSLDELLEALSVGLESQKEILGSLSELLEQLKKDLINHYEY